MKRISFTLAMLASSLALAEQPLQQVSFSAVQKLAFQQPLRTIEYGKAKQQFIEHWPAESISVQTPTVVLIHGGCWLNAYGIDHIRPLASSLSKAGYAVYAIEYRRVGDDGGGWPGSFDDIKNAVSIIAKQNKDKSLVLSGHSAGGHLALLAGKHFQNNDQVSIAGVIGLAAISDIEQYSLGTNSCQTATPKFMGGTVQTKAQEYDTANPMSVGFHPNTVLIHGDKDNIVSLQQSVKTQLHLETVEGAGHFDLIHTETPAMDTLLKVLQTRFN